MFFGNLYELIDYFCQTGKRTMEPIKYIATNDRDHKWGLTVCSVGYQKVAPDEDYPPQKHESEYLFSPANGRILSEYQLLYIVEGEGMLHTRNGGSFNIMNDICVGNGYCLHCCW